MNFRNWLALCLIALMATAVCSAQGFPLRPGEWTSTTPNPMNPNSPAMTMLFCMDDATWTKALKGSRTCSLDQLSLNSKGGSYSLNCEGTHFQMKGKFKLSFDGLTHMTSTGSIDTTFNGQTMHADATSDFHWKGPICDPNADVNLRDHSKPPQ
jgi:hypothetical protein